MKTYRKQKLKLVKDLAENQNNLCQSLLDLSEFQNLNEAFQKKKNMFNIQKRIVNFTPYIPISQQHIQYDMTAAQKLQLYRKEKIKEKYNTNFANESIKKIFKIRRSKIPNMLNNLNQSTKKQPQEIFAKQIKTSQQKLNFFRSQGKLKKDFKNSFLFQKSTNQNRCRFYSLKNGKPQMNQKLFPTFEEYVDGKNRAKLQEKYHFDISKLQKNLSSFYIQSQQNNAQQQQIKKGMFASSIPFIKRQKIQKQLSVRGSANENSQRSFLSQTQTLNKDVKTKLQDVYRYSERSICKSEKSSRKIVKTMTNFYEAKNSKKKQYNNMIEFYDHDRPLTNEIRRKEYSLGEKLRELNFYRNESERKRKEILNQNSQVYMEILDGLGKYHEDDIPISLQILNAVRQLMKKQYIFSQNEMLVLLKDIKMRFFLPTLKIIQENPEAQCQDFMIHPTINILNKAYNFNFNWQVI